MSLKKNQQEIVLSVASKGVVLLFIQLALLQEQVCFYKFIISQGNYVEPTATK